MLLFKNDLIRCIDCIYKEEECDLAEYILYSSERAQLAPYRIFEGKTIYCNLHKKNINYDDFCSWGIKIVKNSRMKRDGVK